MILCDAGPLIALVDPKEAEHLRCSEFVTRLSENLVTTWPCITEAIYLAGRSGGYPLQQRLWRLLNSNAFEFCSFDKADALRMEQLMQRYRNVPMDLADSSLVVAAAKTGVRRLLTLDSDFLIYRLDNGGAFELALD